MILWSIILFLAASFWLYTLLGGADFGAGLVELFSPKSIRSHVSHAMGPVWEANHIWLIIVIVILFMGFPEIYTTMSVYLHIPLVLMLLGIIFRGTAFTFRHYNPTDGSSEEWFSRIFILSSLMTPFFLGIILAATATGRLGGPQESFLGTFILPWIGWFELAVGIFTCILFGYLASSFLAGESLPRQLNQHCLYQLRHWLTAAVLSGLVVFITSFAVPNPLITQFLDSKIALAFLLIATAMIVPTWILAGKAAKGMANPKLLRVLVSFQITMILAGWVWVQFPTVITLASGNSLTVFNTAAPLATLKQLLLALVIGSLFIFPALIYLFRVFKFREANPAQ